jgi:adenylate cyclase
MSQPKRAVPPPRQGIERKLAAILSADVAGYSRLMNADEVGTLHTLTTHRAVTDSLIQHYHGRIVSTAGDSILAEFASAVDAVQCAVEIQQALKTRNVDLPAEQKMEFRMGINVGDVMVEGEQIYGDGVNVAARLQGLADVGGLFISGTVYDQVKNKLVLHYEDLGEQEVKNIAEPVRVWRVRLDEAAATGEAGSPKSEVRGPESKKESPKPRRVGTPVLVFVSVLLLGGIVILRYPVLSPLITRHSSLVTQEAPALPLPDKPSIVVLPFVNMSGDSGQEYFSDGITEVLTSNLSQISTLFVIARNSAFTYKGKAVKVQEVSRELGVRYAVEGSVQKAEDRVRIIAQLIDATTDRHLWSESYDRPLQDIFAVQDDITQQIVAALRVKVMEAEMARVQRIPTENLTAYDFYLRGLGSLRRALVETNKEARIHAQQMFEKAIELDPQYAEAYAGLSLIYFLDWFFLWDPTPQVLARWSEVVHKAIALNASLPSAHAALAWLSLWKRQHEQAIAEAEKALALDPNSAQGHLDLGLILVWAGRPGEAIGLIEKAMRLNPRHGPIPLVNLGWAYQHAGQYAEALIPLKKALPLMPNFLGLHWILAICYAELGREAEAQAEAAEILRIYPQFSVEAWRSFMPYKDPATVERELAGLRKAGLK